MKKYHYIIATLLLLGIGIWIGSSYFECNKINKLHQQPKPKREAKKPSKPSRPTPKTTPKKPPPIPANWAEFGKWHNSNNTFEFEIMIVTVDAHGTEHPVPNASITIGVAGSYPPQMATTDHNGLAKLKIEDGGAVEYVIQAGQGCAWGVITDPRDASLPYKVVITRGAPLDVEVLDQNGNQLKDANVVVTKDGMVGLAPLVQTTNQDGRAHFGELAFGSYNVAVSTLKAPPETVSIDINASIINELGGTFKVTVQLKKYVAIAGRIVAKSAAANSETTTTAKITIDALVAIYSKDSGSKSHDDPLPSAIVTVNGAGEFRADAIPSGDIFLVVQADGYQTTRTLTEATLNDKLNYIIELEPEVKKLVKVENNAGDLVPNADVILAATSSSGYERILRRSKSDESGSAYIGLPVTHDSISYLLYATLGNQVSQRFSLSAESLQKKIILKLQRPLPPLRLRIENVPTSLLKLSLQTDEGVCSLTLVGAEAGPPQSFQMLAANGVGLLDFQVDGCENRKGTLTATTDAGSIDLSLDKIDGAKVRMPEPLLGGFVVEGPTSKPYVSMRGHGTHVNLNLVEQPKDNQWRYKFKAWQGTYSVQLKADGFSNEINTLKLISKEKSKELTWVMSPLTNATIWIVDRRNSAVAHPMVRVFRGHNARLLYPNSNPFVLQIEGKQLTQIYGFHPKIGWGKLVVHPKEDLHRPLFLTLNRNLETPPTGSLKPDQLSMYGVKVYPGNGGILLDPESGSPADEGGLKRGDLLIEAGKLGQFVKVYLWREGNYQSVLIKDKGWGPK